MERPHGGVFIAPGSLWLQTTRGLLPRAQGWLEAFTPPLCPQGVSGDQVFPTCSRHQSLLPASTKGFYGGPSPTQKPLFSSELLADMRSALKRVSIPVPAGTQGSCCKTGRDETPMHDSEASTAGAAGRGQMVGGGAGGREAGEDSKGHLPRKRLRGDGPRGPSRGSGACGHSQEVQLLRSPSQTEPQDLPTLNICSRLHPEDRAKKG